MTTGAKHGEIINLAGNIEYAADSIISKTYLDKKSGTLTHFSFAQGQGLSEHTSPYDATVIVTEGVGTLVIGGESLTVKAGEMVIMPANIPHSVKAEEKFKMLLVMIR